MAEILDFVRHIGMDSAGTGPAWGILLRVTVLLLAAVLAALALRRASAALRHLVWTLALAGTLLVPLCSRVSVPMTWGLWQPVILIPAPMLCKSTPNRDRWTCGSCSIRSWRRGRSRMT